MTDETYTVFDPFLGKEVEISERLTDRLRGRYASGPTLPNGEPEFGWREFGPTPPIQLEAAAEIDRLRAELAALAAAPQATDPLDDLVRRFSAALLDKLRDAERKYGHNDSWLDDDWAETLRLKLREHVEKGDPRDVAAYCAFAWHHGWSIAAPQATDPRDGEISDLRAYALELQRALTGLTLGGSEFFVRHGDDFRADIRACVARVNEIRASAHDRLLEAVRERKAAESRIATLTAERDAALTALDKRISELSDQPFDIFCTSITRCDVSRLIAKELLAIRALLPPLTTQSSKTETRDDG